MLNYKLVLASTSPRRSEILTSVGIMHVIQGSGYDESVIKPESFDFVSGYVGELAYNKAHSVGSKLNTVIVDKTPNILVLGCDTVTYQPNEAEFLVQGKPKDALDALNLWASYFTELHDIRFVTGHVLMHYQLNEHGLYESIQSYRKASHTTISISRLLEKGIALRQIEYFLRNNDSYDLLGCCGAVAPIVQLYMSDIKGSWSNALGLDLAALRSMMDAMELDNDDFKFIDLMYADF